MRAFPVRLVHGASPTRVRAARPVAVARALARGRRWVRQQSVRVVIHQFKGLSVEEGESSNKLSLNLQMV